MRTLMARGIVALALVTAACATNPATGQRQLMLVSESQEIAMGREADLDVRKSMGVYRDAALQAYVREVGMRLARASHRPNLPWTFTVVDTPAVNAFALPGGFIYITRGILPYLRDESELAAVLGHEVGHVDARHGAAQMSKQQLANVGVVLGTVLAPKYGDAFGLAGGGLGILFLKFGREAELEADRLGTGYAARNGWDPGGMPGLLDTLARLDGATGSSRGVPNWALTHPPAADRVVKVQEAVAAARTATSTVTNKTSFERHLGGVIVGDSRDKGVMRNGEFVHPILRFGVRFPTGWEIANSDEAVMAQPAGDGGAAIVLQQVTTASDNLARAADASMRASNFAPTTDPGIDTTVNGLPAFIGTYEGVIERTRVLARAGLVRHGTRGQAYRVLGLSAAADFRQVGSAADATIRSFRPLSAAEADAIQDAVVRLVPVRAGDTWESLAAGRGVSAATLAIMNGMPPGSRPPAPGTTVRLVR